MNDLVWITMQVLDVERARIFWREAIGLKELSASEVWVELEIGPGIRLALHPVFHGPALERRGYDRGGPVLGLRVASLDEMGAMLERHGAKALGPPHRIPQGRARDFEDPEGYVFELVELSS